MRGKQYFKGKKTVFQERLSTEEIRGDDEGKGSKLRPKLESCHGNKLPKSNLRARSRGPAPHGD
jgi:hypothetical protein